MWTTRALAAVFADELLTLGLGLIPIRCQSVPLQSNFDVIYYEEA